MEVHRSLRGRFALAFGVWALYLLFLLSAEGVAPVRLLVALVPALLYTVSGRLKRLFEFSFPFFLAIILYDSQRFVADHWRGEIHVAEPYLLEKSWFGVSTDAGWMTLNEWWQLRTHPLLDFFTGLSYITYIPVFLFITGYIFFYLRRSHPDARVRYYVAAQAPQMMWAFLMVNLLGVATSFLYPASPPWYVAAHGLGPVDPTVPASMAGCARFDSLLGIGIFKIWYGNSANAHGAIPSLHIAYPLQAALYAWKFGVWRRFATGFFLLVAFAAVYLNHHYLIDVLLGAAFASLSVLTVDTLWNLRFRARSILFIDRMPLRVLG